MKVTAGSYPQTKDRNGSVPISFGNLYSREVRQVIVGLLLSEIEGDRNTKSLKVLEEVTPTELQAEEARLTLHTAKVIKEARSRTDCLKLRDAQDKLAEAQNMLAEQSDPLLMTELQELRRLFKSPATYEERSQRLN